MQAWLIAAGIASAAVCGIHVFLGGPVIARPLLQVRGLHDVARYTNYYCWHMVTMVLAAMAAGYLIAAFRPAAVELAWASTIFAATFAIWSIALVVWKRQKPFDLPQWLLFLIVAGLGLVGLTV